MKKYFICALFTFTFETTTWKNRNILYKGDSLSIRPYIHSLLFVSFFINFCLNIRTTRILYIIDYNLRIDPSVSTFIIIHAMITKYYKDCVFFLLKNTHNIVSFTIYVGASRILEVKLHTCMHFIEKGNTSNMSYLSNSY